VHSPVTERIAAAWAEVTATAARDERVFMKTGASTTVNPNALHCFATGPVDLGVHDDLEGTLAHYLEGDAAGTTPFDRPTLAAEVGETASWAIAGDPSPLDAEWMLLDPRVALVHFGTNDMEAGVTYESALPGFYAAMSTLLDSLIERGTVPVVHAITRRGDSAEAQLWVPTYNAVLRGMAQARLVPFVDIYVAIDPLPGHGLAGDGLHLEAYSEGACILDAAGLEHGYNQRNLVVLEGLDRLRTTLESGQALDDVADELAGEGTFDAPYEILDLPFAHSSDTSESGGVEIDAYPDCGSDADESGPELVYRIELVEETAVRAVVLDLEDVDVDVHLLDASGDAAGCVVRGDTAIGRTLAPGTWYFVVDTFVTDEPLAGPYTFVVHACEPGDLECL
jgi:hypothetical protein